MYEEQKAEIAELRQECKYLTEKMHRVAVMGAAALVDGLVEPDLSPTEEVKPEPEVVDDVTLALRQAGGNRRKAAQLITKQNDETYQTNSAALRMIEGAVQEGRAAAQGNA